MNAKYVAEVFRIHKYAHKNGFKIDTAKGVFDVKKGAQIVATFNKLEQVEAFVIGRVGK